MMKQLPESLLYGTRFMFVVAITLMTPLCEFMSDVFSLKYTFQGIHSIIVAVLDFLMFAAGMAVLLRNHKYIVDKELEHGIKY